MKKIFVFLAASALVASCSKLKENEYEIAGTIDPSFNGKNIVLEQQGGFMGFIPLDTVKVENGKFLFKGTATDPAIHFLSIEGKNDGKVFFILENGEIDIKVDKDTLYKSVQSGTYNNEMLAEYYKTMEVVRKKDMAFRKKNQAAIMQARQANDTAAVNKINKEYKEISKENETKSVEFIKNNPKAYINIFIMKQMMQMSEMDKAMLKKLFDGLDADVKKTKEGKELGEAFDKLEKQQKGQANTEVGKMAPDFTAPNPEGKKISLKESLGKVTIIDFWASWCGPCRKENPSVVAMYNELHSKGLNIIGVSLDDKGDKWKEAIAADKLTWTHVSNLRKWEDPIAFQYGVGSIPATFILDASGKIVAKDLRGAELKAKVEELLAK